MLWSARPTAPACSASPPTASTSTGRAIWGASHLAAGADGTLYGAGGSGVQKARLVRQAGRVSGASGMANAAASSGSPWRVRRRGCTLDINRSVVYVLDADTLTLKRKWGSIGGGPGQFRTPLRSPSMTAWCTLADTSRVQRFTPEGESSGAATTESLVQALTLDAAGRLYLSNPDELQRLDPDVPVARLTVESASGMVSQPVALDAVGISCRSARSIGTSGTSTAMAASRRTRRRRP